MGTFRVFAGVTVLMLLSASMAPAQEQRSDSRWAPWLGCWIPAERRLGNQDVQVCVLPTSDGRGVRMMTFAGDQRILDETTRADGSPEPVNERDCVGSTRSTWSRDGARVFRVADISCQGKPPQQSSGISTMTGPDEWLDLQVVVVDGSESVRTRRYVRSSNAPPAAISEDVRGLAARRRFPLKAVTVDDVVEARGVVPSRAVEAWLAEAGARVPIDRRALVRLEGADVSRNVIDLLVALAYPKHFEIRTPGSSGSFGSLSGLDYFGSWSDPFGLAYDPYAFYYSPFGSYFGGLDPYALTYGSYVTIPETGAAAPPSGRGRVVNGSGYTQVEPRQPPAAARRSSENSSYDTSGGSSGGSSSSSDGGGGSASPAGYSSGGSDSGQTAVPR